MLVAQGIDHQCRSLRSGNPTASGQFHTIKAPLEIQWDSAAHFNRHPANNPLEQSVMLTSSQNALRTLERIPTGAQQGIARLSFLGFNTVMPTLEQIEQQVRHLPKVEQEALLDWLGNLLEDELEFTDEFKAKIERGEQDIREGRVRIRKPGEVS